MSIDPNALEIVKTAINTRAGVFLASSSLDFVFETNLLALQNETLLVENRVRPEFISAFVKGERFSLQVQKLRLESSSIQSDGEHIVFPLESLRQLDETRQSERFPFSAEEQVICQFVNPHDNETILRKAVMDMSSMGISLRAPRHSDLFSSVERVPDMTVMIADKLYSRATGQAVYQRKLFDRSGRLKIQIGVKFLKPGE